MAEPATPPPLAPDAAAKFAEFARACKAAARAVALYPGTHPAIGVSLSRLTQATARLAGNGPFKVQVRADSLLLDGALPQRPDPAIGELAEVLYRHMIGALTVNAAADAVGFYEKTGWRKQAWNPAELTGMARNAVQMQKEIGG